MTGPLRQQLGWPVGPKRADSKTGRSALAVTAEPEQQIRNVVSTKIALNVVDTSFLRGKDANPRNKRPPPGLITSEGQFYCYPRQNSIFILSEVQCPTKVLRLEPKLSREDSFSQNRLVLRRRRDDLDRRRRSCPRVCHGYGLRPGSSSSRRRVVLSVTLGGAAMSLVCAPGLA